MKNITLGKTGITVPQNGFGALPVQRRDKEAAVRILRRAPSLAWLSDYWQAEMEKTKQCLHCGQCTRKCPYELDTPSLLEKNYADYQTFL